jgi:hypothetical protein
VTELDGLVAAYRRTPGVRLNHGEAWNLNALSRSYRGLPLTQLPELVAGAMRRVGRVSRRADGTEIALSRATGQEPVRMSASSYSGNTRDEEGKAQSSNKSSTYASPAEAESHKLMTGTHAHACCRAFARQ